MKTKGHEQIVPDGWWEQMNTLGPPPFRVGN